MWDVCFHSQIVYSNIEHLSNIDEITVVKSQKIDHSLQCGLYNLLSRAVVHVLAHQNHECKRIYDIRSQFMSIPSANSKVF